MTHLLKQAATRARHFTQNNPTTVNYGIDGLLIMGAMGIATNNNNLFAMRLGATEFQLGMLHFFPSLFALFILIPAGIFTDSLRNKRRMISIMMLVAAAFFVVVATSAFVPTGVGRVYFFLLFFALAAVSVNGLYNLAWMAFFPEAVPETARNNVLTFRARMTMLVSLVIPLAIGGILTAIPSEPGKIRMHQVFYLVSAGLLVTNAFHFRKISATQPAEPKRISFTEMKTALGRIIRNRQFVLFTLVILLFHATWHYDWTLYFIGQANYLHMNEFMLSLTNVGTTIAQLLTLKFWSRRNTTHGVDKTLTFGMLGLSLNPIAMIISTSLPAGGMYVFLALHFGAMLTFTIVTLNVFQCMLQVVDEKYRSFSMSIYTCLIMVSNAIMPMVGVGVYNGFGGNLNGLRIAFGIAFVLRVVAAGLWVLRVRYFRKQVSL